MAKKKAVANKKKTKKQDAYVQAIIVMIFSLVLAVLIYVQSGYIGQHLSPMLGGIMGWIKYLVPIGAFIVGIILTRERKEFVIPKLLQYCVIILCVCAFMSSLQLSNHELNINDEFSDIVSEAYDLGTESKGRRRYRSTCFCAND